MILRAHRYLVGLAIVATTGCTEIPTTDRAAHGISVAFRPAAHVRAASVPMAECTEVAGPVELVLGLHDPQGLAAARMTFSGGFAPEGVRISPGGTDIRTREAVGAGVVAVSVAPVAPGQSRTSLTLNVTTAAPYTGTVAGEVRDRRGSVTRFGPYRLVGRGGCD